MKYRRNYIVKVCTYNNGTRYIKFKKHEQEENKYNDENGGDVLEESTERTVKDQQKEPISASSTTNKDEVELMSMESDDE